MTTTFKRLIGSVGWLGLCALIPTAALSASAPLIRVGSTTPISVDAPKTPLGETWLAANPRDPKNLIAVSMAFPKQGPWASVMYRSTDGGASWQRVSHGRKAQSYFWGADPFVTFGSDGTAYYTDLEWGPVGKADFDQDTNSHDGPLSVRMFRSTDGGRTWSDPIALDGVDHSCMAIDESGGKYSGRVYVAYTTAMASAQGRRVDRIGIAYSDDDGVTYRQRVFTPPELKSQNGVQVGPSPTDLVVMPDGTLVLPYIYYLHSEKTTSDGSQLTQQTWVITSADGGRTFSDPHLVATASFPGSEVEEGKIAYWPRMAVDSSSGPNGGRLYITNERMSGKRAVITVLNSRDDGQTWGAEVKVDDDDTSSDSNTASIAVSESGIVGVSWYDRRNDPHNECFQEYFSASLDGGVTFLPNAPVRSAPTCTVRSENSQPNVSQSLDISSGEYSVELSNPGVRFINGGETQGLVALAGGKFQSAWIDGESGVMQLAATQIEVTGTPLGLDIGDLLEVATSRPELDLDRKMVSMQVTATNGWRRAMVGPLTLVLSGVGSGFEGLRAVNADNGLSGTGASWSLTGGSGSDLAPGHSTKPVTLRFRYTKAPDKMREAPLSVEFHIFERRRSSARRLASGLSTD